MSGKPGRSGSKPTPARQRVVPLFKKGMRPAEIVATVGLSKQSVSLILRTAGLDPRAESSAVRRALESDVLRLRQANLRRPAIAARLGLTVLQVTVCLANLRRRGLLSGPRQPMPRPKSARVEALLRRGLTVDEVVAEGVAAPNTVRNIRRRLGERGDLDYQPRPRVVGPAHAELQDKVSRLFKAGHGSHAIAKRLKITVPQAAWCLARLRRRRYAASSVRNKPEA